MATGLNATARRMSSPLLMPPWMPPLWLRARAHLDALAIEGVVVLGAAQARGRKALPNLEAARGRQTEHRFRKVGRELVEHGLTEPGWHLANDTAHDASHAIAVAPRVFDGLGHRLGRLEVGTAHVGLVHDRAADRVLVDLAGLTSATLSTQATISVPHSTAKSCSASAPAATRPMVSRAEARPPPATARSPYLAS